MDEKSFHKWAAQQSQSLSEVLEKLRHNEPQLSTDAQSHLSAIFSVSSPRRTDELAEWCFKMSGFRMSRLDERGEMRSGKSEKHLDNPQSSGFRPSWATKLTRNWRRTQSCCRSRWTDGFFFSLWSFLSVIYWSAFPGRVQTLHRADAMTFWS